MDKRCENSSHSSPRTDDIREMVDQFGTVTCKEGEDPPEDLPCTTASEESMPMQSQACPTCNQPYACIDIGTIRCLYTKSMDMTRKLNTLQEAIFQLPQFRDNIPATQAPAIEPLLTFDEYLSGFKSLQAHTFPACSNEIPTGIIPVTSLVHDVESLKDKIMESQIKFNTLCDLVRQLPELADLVQSLNSTNGELDMPHS